MARFSRDDSESSVSLFPFLSILACMIGTLALMITGLALTGMRSRTDESIMRAEEYVALQRANENMQKKLNEIQPLAASLMEVEDEISRLQNLLEMTREQVDLKARFEELTSEKDELMKLVNQLRERRDELRAEIEELTELIARAGDASVVERIVVLPPSSHQERRDRIHFIEVNADGLVVYDEGDAHHVARGDFGSDRTLQQLLQRASRRGREEVILMIRPEGVDNYRHARHQMNRHDIVAGEIPLIGRGELDLSRF